MNETRSGAMLDVLATVRAYPGQRVDTLVDRSGWARSTVETWLTQLVRDGIVRRKTARYYPVEGVDVSAYPGRQPRRPQRPARDVDLDLLAALECGDLTAHAAGVVSGCTTEAARTRLRVLMARGLVVRDGDAYRLHAALAGQRLSTVERVHRRLGKAWQTSTEIAYAQPRMSLDGARDALRALVAIGYAESDGGKPARWRRA